MGSADVGAIMLLLFIFFAGAFIGNAIGKSAGVSKEKARWHDLIDSRPSAVLALVYDSVRYSDSLHQLKSCRKLASAIMRHRHPVEEEWRQAERQALKRTQDEEAGHA